MYGASKNISFLDLLFIRDKSNNITTKLHDKRHAFGFHIVKFPFMSGNIPSAPVTLSIFLAFFKTRCVNK